MKKLFILITIVCMVFVSQNTEKYSNMLHEQIDTFIPSDTQEIFSSIWQKGQVQYRELTSDVNTLRDSIKSWSIDSSIMLIREIAPEEFILEDKSFSPILDNSRIVYSDASNYFQKAYGGVLFIISFLFWNFMIFATWVCILAYMIIKSTVQRLFPRRKKSFFDRINEGVKREMDDDWE